MQNNVYIKYFCHMAQKLLRTVASLNRKGHFVVFIADMEKFIKT